MAKRKPEKLAEKLLQVRTALGLSQRGLIRMMGMADELTQAEISMFESGTRVPSLLVIRKYALLTGVWVDYLIEDAWELPEKIPAKNNKN